MPRRARTHVHVSSRHRKQKLKCCGYEVDSATIVGSLDEKQAPAKGDFSVCIGCGCWHRFVDDKGTLRPFLADDYLDPEVDDDTLATLRKATAAVKHTRALIEAEKKETERGRRRH